jgi:uncharacterized membrane protein YgdD (TMEM256/DUF423 family)
MKILELAGLIANVLWLASCVYLIYSIGKSVLTLSPGPLIAGIIIFSGALLAVMILAHLIEY